MVKEYLSRKGVEFTEHNTSTDRDALTSLISMGYKSTPVTIIGKEKVVGYSPAKIDKALELLGV